MTTAEFIITNGASVLQPEFRDSQRDESVFIGLESMPLHQQIERGHGKAQMELPLPQPSARAVLLDGSPTPTTRGIDRCYYGTPT